MLDIDGSLGEGGGQILRTSLTLSLATGQPVRVTNIRAGRPRPGLMRQHLRSVEAAAAVGQADVAGAALNSREVVFRPGPVRPGDYQFAVGTAGSASLVLQTVLPVLLTAEGPSRLALEGGTHNDHAPPFDFLDRSFLPLVCRMGPAVSAGLVRPGFYPAGGGRFEVDVEPAPRLGRLDLLDRGDLIGVRARAIVSRLPRHIAERELKVVARRLSLPKKRLEVVEEDRSPGPGNVVIIEIESAHVTEVITGFGAIGVTAETVASRAARAARDYLASDAPVGRHLADQLLVPLALGAGGRFRTFPLTPHTRTNIEVIRRFLDADIHVEEHDDGTVVSVNV